MEVYLQVLRVADDPERLLCSRQRHVESAKVGEEADRLDGMRIFESGADAGEYDNIALPALKRVHRADFDELEVLFELRDIDGRRDARADLMHLRGVRRDNADGVSDRGGRQEEEEAMDEVDDEIGFARIEKTGATLRAERLKSSDWRSVRRGDRGRRSRERRSAGRDSRRRAGGRACCRSVGSGRRSDWAKARWAAPCGTGCAARGGDTR